MSTNNSDIVIIIVSAAVALLLLLVFIISFLFIYKNRQVRSEAALKSVTERYNREMLQTQLEIREQTLKNISEEIHDNMGQVLSLVVLNLSAVQLEDVESATSRIARSTALVQKVITDLRNLSKTLDAENMLKVGLRDIIAYELELLEKTGRLRTFFSSAGSEVRLEASRETIAYRIVQESLNNVIKHAQATELHVSMRFDAASLVISIADNGGGFDAAVSFLKNGAGLKNMRNRAKLIGGDLEVRSVISSGTTIVLAVPVAVPVGISVK